MNVPNDNAHADPEPSIAKPTITSDDGSSPPPWSPRTIEDRLIHAYHTARHGSLWRVFEVYAADGP